MIAGLVPPTEGRVLLDGVDVTHRPPRERDLAMVFQSYALYPHLSVASNLGFPLRARHRTRAEIRQKVEVVAAQLGLTELLDRRPRHLSGGQRQRVALGRALVREPSAFLMDEPLSNLDARLRGATRAELSELHRALGATFVYVTHDQVEAMTMATTVALLDGGRLVQVGAPAEVYDRPASTFVAGFLGAPPMNLIPAQVRHDDGALRVVAEGLDLPFGLADQLPTRDVLLGIRPEQLRLTSDNPAIRATVRAIENLGGDELAHADLGAARITVRGPRPLGLRPGDALGATAHPDHLHLFDPASGLRLHWQPAPVPTPV
jgi:multiple sugar transport system ATP-binding protein